VTQRKHSFGCYFDGDVVGREEMPTENIDAKCTCKPSATAWRYETVPAARDAAPALPTLEEIVRRLDDVTALDWGSPGWMSRLDRMESEAFDAGCTTDEVAEARRGSHAAMLEQARQLVLQALLSASPPQEERST
jgi:hypothetical protein